MKIRAIINAKVGNPIIPRNSEDPAGQFGNLRNGNAQLKRRYTNIEIGLRSLISSFNPVLKTNNGSYHNYSTELVNNVYVTTKAELVNNVNVYEYQLDAQRYNSISLFLQRLLYDELLENPQGTLTNRWWMNANLTSAYTDGASDALQSAKNIAPASVVGLDISQRIRGIQLDQIVFSQGFQSRVGLVQSRVFENMHGLVDSTKADLADALARGMASGKGVRELTKDVVKRVGVSQVRAKRIVRTEVLNAYRTATSAETDVINEDVYADSEWGMLQLWWSALSPTSRPNHVIKHGETFTTQAVREFYDNNGEAINCLCSQSPTLTNKKTGEMFQEPLQKRMRKKKEMYQLARGLGVKK
tara:strand:- start:606 stop:1679 length:1074 start_codon:yes stop_codon:yes gene_type:complete